MIKNNLSEYEHQVQVFEWAKMMEVQKPELKLLNASLMGVHVSLKLLNKYKKAGVKKGYPDLFLPVPRGEHHGLFIELKKIGGRKPKDEQKQWLEDLQAQGYDCYTCFGSEQTIFVIISYLNGKKYERCPGRGAIDLTLKTSELKRWKPSDINSKKF